MLRPAEYDDVGHFRLTEAITVKEAIHWIATQDNEAKTQLLKLIHHRFYNRYLKHLSDRTSGFLIMAVSCLMIEALESFRQGLRDTKERGAGPKAFKDFFRAEAALFPDLLPISNDFYYNVRCGILHQAETNNAWRIVRKKGSLLYDKNEKTLNALAFKKAMIGALNNYMEQLSTQSFDGLLWKNAIKKLIDVCDNCRRNPL